MRRGFTLVELMFASAISLVVMAAMVVAFGSIWRLMKESNDELQLTLHARAVRERILYRLDERHAGLFYSKFLSADANALRVKVEQFAAGETASSDPTADSSAPLQPEQIDFPSDFTDLDERVKPVGSDQQLCDNVYPFQFLENEASTAYERNLIRLNLHYPNDATRSLVYEDHILIFLDVVNGEVGQL